MHIPFLMIKLYSRDVVLVEIEKNELLSDIEKNKG